VPMLGDLSGVLLDFGKRNRLKTAQPQ